MTRWSLYGFGSFFFDGPPPPCPPCQLGICACAFLLSVWWARSPVVFVWDVRAAPWILYLSISCLLAWQFWFCFDVEGA